MQVTGSTWGVYGEKEHSRISMRHLAAGLIDIRGKNKTLVLHVA